MRGYCTYCDELFEERGMESHITSSHPQYREVREKFHSLIQRIKERKLKTYRDVLIEFHDQIKDLQKLMKREIEHILIPTLAENGVAIYGICEDCGSDLILGDPALGAMVCSNKKCGSVYYSRGNDFIAQMA